MGYLMNIITGMIVYTMFDIVCLINRIVYTITNFIF